MWFVFKLICFSFNKKKLYLKYIVIEYKINLMFFEGIFFMIIFFVFCLFCI